LFFVKAKDLCMGIPFLILFTKLLSEDFCCQSIIENNSKMKCCVNNEMFSQINKKDIFVETPRTCFTCLSRPLVCASLNFRKGGRDQREATKIEERPSTDFESRKELAENCYVEKSICTCSSYTFPLINTLRYFFSSVVHSFFFVAHL
jgi:hypothetical protein